MCGARTKTSGVARKWREKAGSAVRRTLCPNTHAAPRLACLDPTSPCHALTSTVVKQNILAGLSCFRQTRHKAQGTPANCCSGPSTCGGAGCCSAALLRYLAAPAAAGPAQLCSRLAAALQAPCRASACWLVFGPLLMHAVCCRGGVVAVAWLAPSSSPACGSRRCSSTLPALKLLLQRHGLWVSTSLAARASVPAGAEAEGVGRQEQQPPAIIEGTSQGAIIVMYSPSSAVHVRIPVAHIADAATCRGTDQLSRAHAPRCGPAERHLAPGHNRRVHLLQHSCSLL